MSETIETPAAAKSKKRKPTGNPIGRPRKPVDLNTPEAQEAIAAAAKKMLGDLTQLRTANGTAAQSGDMEFLRGLAIAISEVTDQGNQRKRVDPTILAARMAARERMGKLLMEAHARGDKPEYRLVAKVYLKERVINPFQLGTDKKLVPTEIIWKGAPSEAMRPINEVAEGIFKAFVESIGGMTSLTKGADTRMPWVTLGGLVVKTDNTATRREVGNLADSNVGTPFDRDDELEIKGPHDPTAEFVHVLGTITPPARQNYAGEKRG